MIGNLSTTSAGAIAPTYPTVHNVPSPSKGTTSNEDTVQLSPETQQHLSTTKASAPPNPVSIKSLKRLPAETSLLWQNSHSSDERAS